MSNVKTSARWINRWSKIFTDITTHKMRFYLVSRNYGKSYFVLQRLKRPALLKKFRRLSLLEYNHHKNCSRKHIKRRKL